MQFKEENKVYFLSPFRIIVFTRIYGSGFPYSSNFHHKSMWEYEQLVSDKPNSFSDLSINIKFHFGIQITKPLLIGTSILISETEESIKNTVDRFFKNKLREKLLLEMEQTKKQFN
jgi:hypothetical protein